MASGPAPGSIPNPWPSLERDFFTYVSSTPSPTNPKHHMVKFACKLCPNRQVYSASSNGAANLRTHMRRAHAWCIDAFEETIVQSYKRLNVNKFKEVPVTNLQPPPPLDDGAQN